MKRRLDIEDQTENCMVQVNFDALIKRDDLFKTGDEADLPDFKELCIDANLNPIKRGSLEV